MKEFFSTRLATISYLWQTQHFAWADLRNLLSWNYWTESSLDSFSPEYMPSIIGLFILIGLLMWWRSRLIKNEMIVPVYGRPIGQLASIVTFIVVVAVSYLFFRVEVINYLSSRLVPLIATAIVVIWIGWVVYYQYRIIPVQARGYLERERFFRYIPKSKEKSSTKKQK